ncbi:hypothetical protein [Paenibacillus andongensis]|uniref:hypothetical protein n=1 Tax=Paenibacillus andongensis TaxID=2975482 RepID=UPI0021BAC1B2|nr:hypothetical protein [Paenibacillus andongensis]
MQRALADTIIPVMKGSLVDSLQIVFKWSLVFVAAGLLLTPLIRRIKLASRKGAEKKMMQIH